MPDVSAILLLVTAIFSAGITWGVMQTRQKSSEEKHVASEQKINETIADLKEVVKELKSLATEFQVLKAASYRNEKDIQDHEARIKTLEIVVAKLQTRNH